MLHWCCCCCCCFWFDSMSWLDISFMRLSIAIPTDRVFLLCYLVSDFLFQPFRLVGWLKLFCTSIFDAAAVVVVAFLLIISFALFCSLPKLRHENAVTFMPLFYLFHFRRRLRNRCVYISTLEHIYLSSVSNLLWCHTIKSKRLLPLHTIWWWWW